MRPRPTCNLWMGLIRSQQFPLFRWTINVTFDLWHELSRPARICSVWWQDYTNIQNKAGDPDNNIRLNYRPFIYYDMDPIRKIRSQLIRSIQFNFMRTMQLHPIRTILFNPIRSDWIHVTVNSRVSYPGYQIRSDLKDWILSGQPYFYTHIRHHCVTYISL